MNGRSAAKPVGRKLGLVLLTGVVVGSMIGGGAFNLPQNMARQAGLGAVIIAWIITLGGMFFLSNTFRILADNRPELKAGIYRYAQAGFGPLAGFLMAWGYWLSSAFGNVAFAVLIMQMLGNFFPVFADGKNWPSILGGSGLIWVMHFTVLSGVKRAVALNVFATIINVIAIGITLIIMGLFVHWGQFSFDFWGREQSLGSISTQVESTMLVTLWVFLGIEAAVVVSDRAEEPGQVGTATFLGLAICTVLYFLLSALPFGVMHQKDLAVLGNPSAAYVLRALVGQWGAIFVNLLLLFSTLFCWLAWTILVAELPHEGAKGGVFPKFLARENSRHAAAPALWVSSIVMQLGLFVVLFAHNAWIWLISITGVVSLPPYLASTAFLWLTARGPDFETSTSAGRGGAMCTGALGTLYSAWLLYAAGPKFLLMSAIVYALGLPVFWFARNTHAPETSAFSLTELLVAIALVVAAIVAIVLFVKGTVGIA